MRAQDLALQRDKYRHLSDEQWRWFLQQVDGKERTADKLPTFAAIEDWWYPVRLSCEQCSSELTARYKSSIVHRTSSLRTFLDLTGGYGVDTYFLSEHFTHADYVEQNAELCRIATHNFASKPIAIHNTTAEEFLQSAGQYDLIFLDPARRDSHGSKVFRLEDCTPNVVELLPNLLRHLTPDGRILLKLSPMLDLTQALKELSIVHGTSSSCTLTWDVHVVAVKNEVKEVLLISRKSKEESRKPTITAIDLAKKEQAFTFTREEENLSAKRSVSEAVCQRSGLSGIAGLSGEAGLYLYEPNAAILKAGAYKLVAQRFGVQKLDANTHLYASEKRMPDFPGRVWRITEQQPDKQANVLTRNYPLTPEQLKKKLHLRDGGTAFVIGCRVAGKPTLFFAERVEDIHSES